MRHPWSGLKEIPRNIWILAAASLINRSGTMVLPFMSLYAVTELKVSAGNAGLVLAAYGMGAFVSAPFTGKLSDRFGSVRLMTISLFAAGIFLIGYSFVTNFYIFLLMSFFWAIIAEAFRPASMSFVSTEAPADRRKTAFALYRLALNLGMSVGPLIGGLLSTINFHLLFYVDGITSIAAAIFLLFSHLNETTVKSSLSKEDDKAPGEDFYKSTSVFKNRKFVFLLLAIIPVVIVFFQFIGAMPLFIVDELGFSRATFGIMISINTLLIIFIEVPLNDAMRNWADWKALMLGALFSGFGFGLLSVFHTIYGIIISIVFWTFGEMIFFPAANDYVSEISPEKRRGEYMGYFQMTFSFAFIIGPWMGTEVLENFGSFTLWVGCLVFGLISALMMLNLKD
ncbi:tetracycline resistance protein, class B [bacterium BMS3Abin03]|nr:tetracycline resistance protein, class B [bacterium BMS3Abin03]